MSLALTNTFSVGEGWHECSRSTKGEGDNAVWPLTMQSHVNASRFVDYMMLFLFLVCILAMLVAVHREDCYRYATSTVSFRMDGLSKLLSPLSLLSSQHFKAYQPPIADSFLGHPVHYIYIYYITYYDIFKNIDTSTYVCIMYYTRMFIRWLQDARRNSPLRHILPIAEDLPPPYKAASETPPPSYEEAVQVSPEGVAGVEAAPCTNPLLDTEVGWTSCAFTTFTI